MLDQEILSRIETKSKSKETQSDSDFVRSVLLLIEPRLAGWQPRPAVLCPVMIMTFTMRRESREEVGHRAWLDTGNGGPLTACTLIDISPSGAKLAIDDAAELPECFSLRLNRYGSPNFSCRIVWRNIRVVGVTFIKAVNEMAGR